VSTRGSTPRAADVLSVTRHRLARYGVAVLVAAVSLAARHFMTHELGVSLPYITLFPAVAFSAWLGGFGPGAICTLLSVAGAAYVWIPSTQFFAGLPTVADGLGLSLFCAIGLFMSALAEARFRAQSRTERQINRVQQAQERERQARDEAERANRTKDEFLAILAHELRQPLAAMVAALGVLRRQLGPQALPPAERSLDVLQRQTTHLQRLVDDLLDASRVVRGEVALQRRAVNALDIVRDAIEASLPRAHERRQRLECRLPDAPIVLDADATRVQQVLLNVLSNAIEYTPPEGDIQVVVDTDATHVTIRVRDSGEGVSAEDLPRIFSLFTRAGGRRGPGLGVGLAVARSLVQLHGGTIEGHSDGLGRGSEFCVRLPVSASSAQIVESP
jgi:signal transduction histidine kinase